MRKIRSRPSGKTNSCEDDLLGKRPWSGPITNKVTNLGRCTTCNNISRKHTKLNLPCLQAGRSCTERRIWEKEDSQLSLNIALTLIFKDDSSSRKLLYQFIIIKGKWALKKKKIIRKNTWTNKRLVIKEAISLPSTFQGLYFFNFKHKN